jgi:ATP-dependent helicase/DNAse subunit B
LLQRAKNIKLYHNTEVKSLSAGEKSRYLLQVELELKKKLGDSLILKKKLISTDIQSQTVLPVKVEKSDEVVKKLLRYFIKGNEDTTYMPKFSASTLSTYINCRLQFYLSHLAKLKELEAVEDYIEANTFGKILHKAMELIYENSPTVNEAFIKAVKPQVESLVLEAINKVFPVLDESGLEGKNLLLKQVIVALIHKILETDIHDLPFKILDLEKNLQVKMIITPAEHPNPKEVMLHGYIDRIDMHEDTVRIMDYKTGDIKLRPASIDELFLSPDHKISFQGYFYAWLYWKHHPDKKIKVGIYPVQKLNQGIQYLNDGEPIAQTFFEEFETRLKRLLQEIFTKEVPFDQLVDTNNCLYCAYTGICNR